MKPSKTTPKKTSLKDAAKISEAFLDEHLDTEVADEALLVRLALAWNSEVARRYPEILKTGEPTLSQGDWCGLALIESMFAKLSREHSVFPGEHERGVAMFLKSAVGHWEERFIGHPPPSLYSVAREPWFYLANWIDPDDTLFSQSEESGDASDLTTSRSTPPD